MADPLVEALAHHKAGRLDQAAELYRRILALNPTHGDSLNLLGVIAHQRGDDRQAVELGKRAIQADATKPSYHANLATAYRGLGRHEEACCECREALKLAPDLLEAKLALGMSLQALKRWPEAEQEFRELASVHLGDSRGPRALANCLREQGRADEAVVQYREALVRNASDAAAHLGLGTTLLLNGDPAAAELYLRRATQLLPRQATAWKNYGTCLMRLGREPEAVAIFQEGLRHAPNDVELGVNLGQAWLASGDARSAENCLREVLKFRPEFPAALIALGDVLVASDRPDQAIPLYDRAWQLEPELSAYKGLAEALWDSGDVVRAVALLRDGVAREPQDADTRVRLATILASGGDLEGAIAECRAALQLRPGFGRALIQLAQTLRGRLPDEERQQLQETLELPSLDTVRAGIHFALAQVADGRDEFAAAAVHLREANALARKYLEAHGQVNDPAHFSRYVDAMIAAFGPAVFERLQGAGVDDERPVFVVGMPRSGTTLIEQILASHPRVFGAGERRFAYQSLIGLATEQDNPAEAPAVIERLTPERVRHQAEEHLACLRELDGGRAARVVDKMPDNYTLLGWLAVEFPKARFIHCRRDVRDVALSCWMTNFSRVHWANDLEHIARRVLDYQRIMLHWREALPVPLLEIDYERLVADPEGVSRRMVEWLRLEWDPACLQFYRSSRLVKTASVTQVRQPIYSRSVGRWRHYQEALRPFLHAMGLDT